MKKRISLLAAALLAAGALSACGSKSTETEPAPTWAETTAAEAENDGTEADRSEAADAESVTEAPAALTVLTVGATPAPHAAILSAAQESLREKGYELRIKEYTDYVQPNLALDSGDLDANFFQHFPYLEQFNQERGTKLVSAASVHYEPFGIYAGKTASLEELADGAKVAVPNDATNEARALLLLEAQGLIKLKEGVGLEATKLDIIDNPKNLNIMEIEAAQIPRSLQDVEIAVINGNYAIEAGLKVSDALAAEDTDSIAATTYGNVIAVKEGNEKNEAIQALVEALSSEEVRAFIETTYEGAVVPLF